MTSKKHDDDHAKHDEPAEVAKPAPAAPAAKAAAEPQVFPYTASINEPQTTSLPLPDSVEVPKPLVGSLEPAEAVVGDPDFTLYVTGEHFFANSVINFGGQDAPTTLQTDGRLSAPVQTAAWTDPATVQVQVKNGPEVSDPVEFAFTAPAARKKK